MEKVNNKKKWTLSELSRNILIPLIPPAVVACVVAPIAIVYGNKAQETETWTVTYDDCFSDSASITTTVKVTKGQTTSMFMPKHRDNYGFLGWKTVKGDKDAPFFNFDNTAITSNVTLYGYWTNEVTSNDYFVFSQPENENGYIVGWNGDKELPSKNIVVPSTYNNKPIIGVAERGFFEVGFESISLPDSIKSFDKYSFGSNANLRIINMPTSLETVGAYCFNNCQLLRQIEFNEGLETIETSAFSADLIHQGGEPDTYCYINKIILPSTLKYVGARAFLYSNVSSIDMSKCNSVDLETYAFYGAESLQNIKLPTRLQYLPEYVFSDCRSLTKIEIPSYVLTIGAHAFDYCTSLQSVVFDDNSQLIGLDNNAFSYCYSLGSIVLPEFVRNIGAGCFQYSAVNSIEFKGKATWMLNGKEWTPSNDGAKNFKELNEYIETKSLTVKQEESSEYQLLYITDGKDRCLITGSNHGYHAGKLTIPAKIGNYKVVGIADNAFEENSEITEVEFGKDNGQIYLEYIKSYAFSKCTNIAKINLNECTNLMYIGDYAFEEALQPLDESNKITIDLSKTQITYLGIFAFWADEFNDSVIEKIVLPSSLDTLGGGAFNGRIGLKSIDFSRCSYLSYIKVDYSLLDTSNSFVYKTDVESIDLSNTKLQYIPYNILSNSTTLKSVKLPSVVKYIDEALFSNNTALTSITIPSDCYWIGKGAFTGCNNLAKATFEDTSTKWVMFNDSGSTDVEVTDPTANATRLKDEANKDLNWNKIFN